MLDVAFGLYRKRMAVLASWGLPGDGAAVLDVGCGTGQYSRLPHASYLGLDFDERLIEFASRRRGDATTEFRAADANTLSDATTYDVVLIVDALHHLSDEELATLLATVRKVGRHATVFEPVPHQTNRLGGWIVGHDRGAHVRPEAELLGFFERAGLRIARNQPLDLGPISTIAVLAEPLRST